MIVVERLDLCFLDKVVLLETPKGFALFNVKSGVLNAPKVHTNPNCPCMSLTEIILFLTMPHIIVVECVVVVCPLGNS